MLFPLSCRTNDLEYEFATSVAKRLIVDFALFTQPSPSTVIDGIEVLTTLFNSKLSSVPVSLKNKLAQLETEVV
jgi:hypothetical protein